MFRRPFAATALLAASTLALSACSPDGGDVPAQEYARIAEENGRLKAQLEGRAGVDDAAMRKWVGDNIAFVIETARQHAAKQRPDGPLGADAAQPQGPSVENFVAAHEKLFDGAAPTEGGRGKGTKIRIAHFFDYNCGWCKRSHPTIQALIEKHPDVEFHFFDLPILDPSSRLAAQAGLAAHAQGKYEAYHEAVYALPRISEGALVETAGKLGLDVAKFTKDMKSPVVVDRVSATAALGSSLGVRGTPFFYVEGAQELVPGAAPIDRFETLLTQIRNRAG